MAEKGVARQGLLYNYDSLILDPEKARVTWHVSDADLCVIPESSSFCASSLPDASSRDAPATAATKYVYSYVYTCIYITGNCVSLTSQPIFYHADVFS